MLLLLRIICDLLWLYLVVIFAEIILSWFPSTGGGLDGVKRVLHTLTDWCLGPLRRAIPPLRMGVMALDLSPLIVIVGIRIITAILCD